jgi:enoyl-CoA hydratase/carnithine racemase
MTQQAVTHAIFETDGPVASLTFNRPEARNAMTWEMYEALLQACDRANADAAIRVLVLKGAGGKAFVSGTDISQFTQFSTRQEAIDYERRLDEVFDRLERVDKPTIAQVQGVATGGGCVIALACDLRICTPDARFGVPIARTLGNCLSAANYQRLIDLVGPARTKDLLFTGRLLEASEALALGLANRIVDQEAIDREVTALALKLSEHAPLTLRATKIMVREIQAARRVQVPQADELIAGCYGSDDFKEGVAAFLAKRAPRFTGH